MKQKILLILLISIFSINKIYPQSSFSEGYNKGWKDGVCYDKTIDCIPEIPPIAPLPSVYEDNNSYRDGYLRGFTDGTNSNSPQKKQERKNIYENTYTQPVDIEFVNNVLKTANNSASSYRNNTNMSYKKEWVASKVVRLIKSAVKKVENSNKTDLKESRRNRRKYKIRDSQNLKTLSNGWYRVMVKKEIYYDDKEQEAYIERFVNVYNNKIISYCGNENLLYSVKNFYKQGFSYNIDLIFPDKSILPTDIFIFDKVENKDLPDFKDSQLLIFYANDRIINGEISVYLIKNGHAAWFDKQINSIPSCKESDGIGKFYLEKGEYEYFAFTDYNFWRGKVNVKAGCNKFQLSLK